MLQEKSYGSRVLVPWFLLVVCGLLGACTVTVDSVADAPDANPGDAECQTAAGSCTLRAAIQEANANFFVARVEVPAGTYNLDLPLAEGGGTLEVSGTVSIRGAGAGATIIDAGSACGSFSGFQALRITAGNVNVRHLTIRGGNGQFGGGVGALGGNIELSDVELTGNVGTTGGAGIFVDDPADVTIRRANIHANCAVGAFGGGIWNSGLLFVYDSLIADNEANRAGGVYNNGTLNLRSTTVSGNEALSPEAGTGGVVQTDFAFLNNVTITQNLGRGDDEASFLGGGLLSSTGATTVVKNSIIAENDGRGGPNDCFGELTADSRHNLIGDSDGCVFAGPTGTFLLDVAPGLEPLAFNGGPTRTHALLPSSVALEAAYPFPPPAAHACQPLDQRGVPRPQGAGVCDMGAYEFTTNNAFVTGFVLVNADTNTDIRPLRDGEQLVLPLLPPSLSVRAVVPGTTGSVVFGFAGNDNFRTENIAPYTLGGDSPPGDYDPVVLPPGEQVLTATPFSNTGGDGAAGGSLTVRFTVIGESEMQQAQAAARRELRRQGIGR